MTSTGGVQAGGRAVATGSERVGVWTWIGLLCALVGPLAITTAPFQWLFALAGSPLATVFVGQAFFWVILAVVLACLVFGEKLPLSSIGLVAPRRKSILIGLAIGFGVFGALLAALIVLTTWGLFKAEASADALQALPLWLRLFLAVTAGVVEEILYRGYAIERLSALLGRRWLAATISLAAFVAAHVPFWGVGAIATSLIGGGFFTLIYLRRRDLIVCITAHIAVDFVGLILTPALMQAFGSGN